MILRRQLARDDLKVGVDNTPPRHGEVVPVDGEKPRLGVDLYQSAQEDTRRREGMKEHLFGKIDKGDIVSLGDDDNGTVSIKGEPVGDHADLSEGESPPFDEIIGKPRGDRLQGAGAERTLNIPYVVEKFRYIELVQLLNREVEHPYRPLRQRIPPRLQG